MLKSQADELHELLVARCTDYVGIAITHLGAWRVKVVATALDGMSVTIVQYLNEGQEPKYWARAIADQLHTVYVA